MLIVSLALRYSSFGRPIKRALVSNLFNLRRFLKYIFCRTSVEKEIRHGFFIDKILNPRWIVSSNGELGIRVAGINMWYYKWPTPMIFNNKEISSEYKNWRYAEKREFGESIISELNPLKKNRRNYDL